MTRPQIFAKNPRTDADVNLLLTRFRDLLPDGRVITHVEVEAVIRVPRTSSYYKTVTKHWRRALFNEQRFFLDGRSAHGEGFKILTPDEMIRWSNARVRAVGRQLRKALIVAVTPRDDEIIDPNTRAWRAHVVSFAEQLNATHGRLLREVGAALRPPAQLPRAATPAR